MKHIVTILSLALLLNACNSQTTKQTANNCPQPQDSLAEININKEKIFYEAFNYQIRNIVAAEDTINFQSLNHDFVFCRSNTSWTIQPGTFKEIDEPQNYEEMMAELADPPYEKVELNGKFYEYRVRLSPNPFGDSQVNSAEKVVFELVAEKSDLPQPQILYTKEQTIEAKTGIQLGRYCHHCQL